MHGQKGDRCKAKEEVVAGCKVKQRWVKDKKGRRVQGEAKRRWVEGRGRRRVKVQCQRETGARQRRKYWQGARHYRDGWKAKEGAR